MRGYVSIAHWTLAMEPLAHWMALATVSACVISVHGTVQISSLSRHSLSNGTEG